MVAVRIRIGESGCGLILKSTVMAGLAMGALKKSDLNRVTVDTTVQEKAVTYLTDAKLLNRVCKRLVKKARAAGLKRRQSYVRVRPKRLLKVNRYAHARQMKRMKGEVKKLRTSLGRLVLNMEHKTGQITNPRVQQLTELVLPSELELAKRYEFGVKVGVTLTNQSNSVVSGLAFPGNSYEGHTLVTQYRRVERITGKKPSEVFVVRGNGVADSQVFISGQMRSVPTRLKHLLKRRQAVEPVTGHIKNDRLLGHNYLKGAEGDQMNSMLSCIGHNMRIILKKAKIFCSDYFLASGWKNQCRSLLSGDAVHPLENCLKQFFFQG